MIARESRINGLNTTIYCLNLAYHKMSENWYEVDELHFNLFK